ncbi:MAG TPA: P-loop NTPase fold protein [Fervidobacterium sp.]|nr:P-loop NTPase fold protein [Fervidobacterium sp.]
MHRELVRAMALNELIKHLVDKPLDTQSRNYLVNRENEVDTLNKIVTYQPYGIFGIAGETGIGKTTVLNFITPKEVFIRKVNISLRDSTDSILYDLTYNLAKSLESDGEIGKDAQSIKEWMAYEVSTVRGFSLGLSMVGSASASFQTSNTPRFDFFTAREKLAELITKTVQSKGKFLLLIDELDKEKKEDVLRTIDAIKSQILFDNFVIVISLPYSIYREYAADRMHWNESGNLENIFKDIVFLEPLSKSDIKELLVKRLHEYLHLISDNVFEIASDFADGNPRDALWIMNKTVFDNIEAQRLEAEHILKTVDKLAREYITTPLTENQRRAIGLLKNFVGTKDKLVECLQESGIKRTTTYSIINQLIEKKIIIERNGVYKLSGKYKYTTIE